MRRSSQAAPPRSAAGLTRTNKAGETYSSAQMDEVQHILRTKDYYEIVGVPRNANEEQVKRAFKKLALRLHPDKNKCPGSEEAFKKLGKAVACLTDAEKKSVYDKYGDEERVPKRQRQQNHHQDFMSDPFEAFFGRHAGFGHGRGGGGQNDGDARNSAPERQQLLQLLLVVLVMLMTLTSPASFRRDSGSIFSFSRTGPHQVERVTITVGATYFVSTEFEDHYREGTRSMREFEHQVEIHYVRRFHQKCAQQEKVMHKKINVAKSRGNKEDVLKAQKAPRQACVELERLRSEHPALCRKAVYLGL